MKLLIALLSIQCLATTASAQSRDGLCNQSEMATKSASDIQELLAQSNGLFLRCYDGYSPLHVAVSAGNLEAIRLIVAAGADLKAKNDFGSTPLHGAILASNVDVAELLLDLGADIHSSGPDSQSPLEFSRQWGEREIEKLLLKRGARF